MARDNVWSNPGGSPGMPIVKIERGSEAWNELARVLAQDPEVPYIRISANYGEFKVKAYEGMWSPPLDVSTT